MQVQFNDRLVEITDFELNKYCEDSYIASAYYVDTEQELTDDELDTLTNECQDLVYQEWYESKVCEAEYLYEGDR